MISALRYNLAVGAMTIPTGTTRLAGTLLAKLCWYVFDAVLRIRVPSERQAAAFATLTIFAQRVEFSVGGRPLAALCPRRSKSALRR